MDSEEEAQLDVCKHILTNGIFIINANNADSIISTFLHYQYSKLPQQIYFLIFDVYTSKHAILAFNQNTIWLYACKFIIPQSIDTLSICTCITDIISYTDASWLSSLHLRISYIHWRSTFGFKRCRIMDANIINLLRDANLGVSDPSNPNSPHDRTAWSPPLKDFIPEFYRVLLA